MRLSRLSYLLQLPSPARIHEQQRQQHHHHQRHRCQDPEPGRKLQKIKGLGKMFDSESEWYHDFKPCGRC